jgi:hypothetical protein
MRELVVALLNGQLIVPLIISGAVIPPQDSMPSGVGAIARYNGISLNEHVFAEQMKSLDRTLSEVLDELGLIEMKLSVWADKAGQPNPILRARALDEIRRLETQREDYLRSHNFLVS